MNADDFVHALAELTPTEAELSEHGLSPEDAAEIRRVFICQRRTGPTDRASPAGVVDLVTRYDCELVAIALFRFASQATPHAMGVQVGWWEADPVVITDDGSALALDHASRTPQVVMRLAKDGERLLAALLMVARVIRTHSGPRSDWVERCARAAGGPEYAEFYRSMLGA